MIPEEGSACWTRSRILPPVNRVWLVTPVLIALLLLRCSRDSDSAEHTTLHAQAQPRVARRNLGYPYARETPSREAARLLRSHEAVSTAGDAAARGAATLTGAVARTITALGKLLDARA